MEHGRPFALLSRVEPDTVEEEILAIRRARARIAIDAMRRQAKAHPRILAEYVEVLRDPRMPFEPHQVDAVLELVHSVGEPVAAMPLSAALSHEGDGPFLEVADAAQAILVTGNPRHFPKRTRGDVRIRIPAELLEVLRRRD